MNIFLSYASALSTSFSSFGAYFGFIHSTTAMLHKSFAACAYASFIVRLLVSSVFQLFGRIQAEHSFLRANQPILKFAIALLYIHVHNFDHFGLCND